MELDRLSGIANGFVIFRLDESVGRDAYAAAIRATKKYGARNTLTAIGRVFLELKGRDAIRWLLHVEVAQSFGLSDPWRISREMAGDIVRQGSLLFRADQYDSPGYWASIKRLAALGLVGITEDPASGITKLEVLPIGRQLLAEAADADATSMSVLVESILADLTLSAASSVVSSSESTAAGFQASAVAEATVRQSRLVAHEIRNMLVPVKTALGAFYREVQIAERPGEVVARRKESIDRGIDSVFRFIGQLVELSQFAATPPEPFDMLVALRDAVSVIESESGRRIEQVLPAQLPPVSGHRARVVTAIANILRNATQAVTAEFAVIRIEAESIEGSSAVRLLVEDNGPGVPESMRRAIFDEGVSLRGGSGLGLALVREVFEKEMRGPVACEASSLGGARFVVRVPTTGTERP
ncbi:sensor histidine kinase [Cystobacter fuscus]